MYKKTNYSDLEAKFLLSWRCKWTSHDVFSNPVGGGAFEKGPQQALNL
jgi:hypothetical protein